MTDKHSDLTIHAAHELLKAKKISSVCQEIQWDNSNPTQKDSVPAASAASEPDDKTKASGSVPSPHHSTPLGEWELML